MCPCLHPYFFQYRITGNISSRKIARTLEKEVLPGPGRNDILGAMIISRIQILFSKYHCLIKGTELLEKMFDSRAMAGTIRWEAGISHDARKLGRP